MTLRARTWREVLRRPERHFQGVPAKNVWPEPGGDETSNGPEGWAQPVPDATTGPGRVPDQEGRKANCREIGMASLDCPKELHPCSSPLLEGPVVVA